jgi:oxygen-dependent protoporphyrinogen oxidase
MSLKGGLVRLVDVLAARVVAAGGVVRTGAVVREVRRDREGWLVSGEGFAPLVVDDVVLAVPAGVAARLLEPLAPAASVALEGIEYAGVATVILAYPPPAVPGALRGTGFLVPPVERRLLVGCSWLTAKWPHLAGDGSGPEGPVLIRGMVGRDGDQVWAGMDDDTLVAAVRAELAESMGVHGEPLAVHVRRMPSAMPQYTVGHADRLAAIDAALAGLPGIRLTGAGYRGVGLSGCIAQANDAAAAVLDRAPRTVTTR